MVRHHKLCLMHKVQRSGEPEQLAERLSTLAETRAAERVTRQDVLLAVPRSWTEMGRRPFHCRWPVLYNELPWDLCDTLFCRRLRHLIAVRPVPD